MLAGVAEEEPRRVWFGRGGCVEQHDNGTFAVFVRESRSVREETWLNCAMRRAYPEKPFGMVLRVRR